MQCLRTLRVGQKDCGAKMGIITTDNRLRKTVYGVILITGIAPANSYAQAPVTEESLQELNEKLERLTKIVDRQAVQIENQAREIDRLKNEDGHSGNVVVDSVAVVEVDDDDARVAARQAERDARSEEGDMPAADGDENTSSLKGRYPDLAIVRPGDFEGSITLPGDAGSFRIGGFVRAQMEYDFDNIGIQGNALPYSVPLDGSLEDGTDQVGFNVRDTQINFDYRIDSDLGLLRAFVEFDFFGEGGDEFNNDFGVRIRHAAVGIGRLQVGQFWSLFTDLKSIPEVVELLGPHGAPVFRTPGLRWYDEIGDNWKWAVGIEDPAGDLTGDASLLASESVPNILGYIERTGDWGHVRLSGIGLELRSTTDKTFTGGGSITGRINVPFVYERNVLFFGGQIGAGFAKQYAGFGGVGLEGVVDDDGNVDATEILAGYIGYQHWWADNWRSNVYASMFDFDQGAVAAPDSLSTTFKTSGNIFWTPVNNLNLGGEVLYITRETVGEDEGDGVRIQFVAQFDF